MVNKAEVEKSRSQKLKLQTTNYKLFEVVTLLIIVASASLLIRSYIPQSINLQKNKGNSSLLNVKDAMLLYYTTNNSYPTGEIIFDIITLKRELSPYVKKDTEFNFSYLSYKDRDNDFELKIRKDGQVFVITAKGVEAK